MIPTRFFRNKRSKVPYTYSPPFLIDTRLRAIPSYDTTHLSTYQNPHLLKSYALLRFKK